MSTSSIPLVAVTMYTTQVCPYCLRAKALLKERGVTVIDEVRIDLDPAARDAMVERTGRRTAPHLFLTPIDPSSGIPMVTTIRSLARFGP